MDCDKMYNVLVLVEISSFQTLNMPEHIMACTGFYNICITMSKLDDNWKRWEVLSEKFSLYNVS